MNYLSQKVELEKIIRSRSDLTVIRAKFQCEIPGIDGATKDFLSTYAVISNLERSFEVGADLLGESSYYKECMTLGRQEYWEVIFVPGDDRIYVVDGSEGDLGKTDDVYSNIYCFLAEELDA